MVVNTCSYADCFHVCMLCCLHPARFACIAWHKHCTTRTPAESQEHSQIANASRTSINTWNTRGSVWQQCGASSEYLNPPPGSLLSFCRATGIQLACLEDQRDQQPHKLQFQRLQKWSLRCLACMREPKKHLLPRDPAITRHSAGVAAFVSVTGGIGTLYCKYVRFKREHGTHHLSLSLSFFLSVHPVLLFAAGC